MAIVPALRGRKNRDILDIALFLLLTLFLPLFLLGRFSLGEGEGNFFLNISNDLGRSLNPSLAIPLLLLFFLFALLLWVRRFPKERHRLRFTVTLSLLAVFVVSRIVGIFAIPYGDTAYTFFSTHYQQIVTLSYEYPISDRIVSFLVDLAFGSYFVIALNLLPTFGKKWTYFLDCVLLVLIAIALAGFIDVMIFEREDFLHNLLTLWRKEEGIVDIISFTPNKNVYGFLLMIGTFSSLVLFVKKANPVTPLLAIFFTFNCVVISSRTPAAIGTIVLLLFSFFYPFFAFRRHKVYSILSFALALCFLVTLATGFLLDPDNPLAVFIQTIYDRFLNQSTVHSRDILRILALEMLNTPFFLVLGYGRIPFHNLFHSLLVAVGGEAQTVTSHNGLADVVMHDGIVGLLLSLLFLLFLIYVACRQFRGLEKEKGVLSLVLIVGYLLYFLFEPRFFTLDEASTVFLLLSFVFPLLDDEQKDVRELSGRSRRKFDLLSRNLEIKGA